MTRLHIVESHRKVRTPEAEWCPICSELDGDVSHNPVFAGEGADLPSVLASTDHFVALPALGALVPGYVLISPRAHVLAMGHLDARLHTELRWFVREVTDRLTATFGGQTLLYEHGACSRTSRGGACVDHAHIHAVPLEERIVGSIKTRLDQAYLFRPCSLGALSGLIRQGVPYLWVGDSADRGLVAPAEGLPSQQMRRIIAEVIGRPDEWDWGLFPDVDNVRRTIDGLTGSRSLVPPTN